jgi:hypothetical protein
MMVRVRFHYQQASAPMDCRRTDASYYPKKTVCASGAQRAVRTPGSSSVRKPSAARECAATSFRGKDLAYCPRRKTFYFVTSNLPKIPSLSMFGPAVKYNEVVAALLLPLPKTSAHSPSTFSALPFLSVG